MAKVTIGGEALEVSLPNFKALKAAWCFIAEVQDASDPLVGIDAILECDLGWPYRGSSLGGAARRAP